MPTYQEILHEVQQLTPDELEQLRSDLDVLQHQHTPSQNDRIPGLHEGQI